MTDIISSLSENQKGIFFLHQINGADAANNLPGAVILRGEIDLVRLQAATDRIIGEQAALRTSFRLTKDGRMEAVISDTAAYTVTLENYEGVFSVGNFENRIDELIFMEAARPFDLSAAPLFRLRILKLAPARHLLLLTMHHIVSDGWSLDVFRENLLRYYNFPDTPGSPHTATYQDYIRAEEELLSSEKGTLLREYWIKRLSGVVPLELPADFPRTALKRYEGARISFTLDGDVHTRLKKFARSEKATPFMILLSVFQVLMHKYTGMRDVVVASPSACRLKSGYENLIGFFVNNLPLRAFVDPEATVRDFIRSNRAVIIESYKHQEYPYGRMVKDLGLFTDVDKFPISDVSFGFDVINQDSLTAIRLDGLEPEEIAQKKIFVPGDLLMFMVESDDGLIGNVEYNSGLFSNGTALALIRHFRILLSNILEKPDSRIADVPMTDEKEEHTVLAFSRGERVPYDAGMSVHECIFRSCGLHRSKAAVRSLKDSYSYGELKTMALTVAENLRRTLKPRSNRIALIPYRRIEMIPVLLGILKAGYVCVPLASELPPERLETVIKDCEADLVVSDLDISLRYEGPVRRMEDLLYEVPLPPDDGRSTAFDETAVILYTSGTTGGPKGVPIRHESLVCYREAAGKVFGIRENSTILSISTVSFDMFLWEVLLSLSNGCTLVIADEDEQLRGSALAALHAVRPFDVILSTPTRFRVLANDPSGAGVLSGMKLLVLGGEQIPPDLLARLRETTSARLFNVYGPTEITFNSTVKDLRSSQEIDIGSVMPNYEVYILSPEGKLLPEGIPGEIYVGGPGVACGYLNRPELTAERFIELDVNPGQRFYRTGDFGKWLPDGNIVFLGRRDHQVKINGYRIETEEIEKYIKEVPGVSDATVVPRHEEDRDVLCAYYVSRADDDERIVRRHLAEKIPGYMIPEHLVRLDAMPVNQNGKVDILKLPQFLASAVPPAGYVAPETVLEKLVCDIWKTVLRTDAIGVNDDFFELGGDSIKAIRILTLLSGEGIELKIHDLYQLRTVARIIGYIGEGRKYTGISEANGFLDAQFGAMNVRLVETEQGCILAVADESLISERLFGMVNENLGEKIFPCDYVVLEEGCTVADAMRRRSDEKRRIFSQRELDGILHDVRKTWRDFGTLVTNGPAVRSFEMSPIQRAHRMLPYRLCGFSYDIYSAGGPDRVLGAIRALILEQQLLHSTLKKSFMRAYWIEHECDFDPSVVPFVDLSACPDEARNAACDLLIRNFLFEDEPFGTKPPFRLFLAKCSPFVYMLYFSADHIIFDVTSSEIVRKRITDLLASRPSLSGGRYSAYVSDISTGAVDVTEEEIIERLDLSSLKSSSLRVRKLLGTVPTGNVICLEKELAINGSLPEQDIWSYSFDECARLYFKLFPLDRLPVSMVYHGRKYGSKIYYDQVGEYIDVIPLVVRKEIEKPSIAALDSLRFITGHSVNFSSVSFGRDGKYRRMKKLLPRTGRELSGFLWFNFAGKFNERERDAVKKMALLRLEDKTDAGALYRSVYFEAMYDENRLRFTLYFYNPRLTERIESHLNSVVVQIGK